jgi:hypothetical protein
MLQEIETRAKEFVSSAFSSAIHNSTVSPLIDQLSSIADDLSGADMLVKHCALAALAELRISAQNQQLAGLDATLALLCQLLSVQLPSASDVEKLSSSSEPFQLTREILQLLRQLSAKSPAPEGSRSSQQQEKIERVIQVSSRITGLFQQKSSTAPLATLFLQLFQLIPSHLASLVKSDATFDSTLSASPAVAALLSTVSAASSLHGLSPLAVHAASLAKFLLFQIVLPSSVAVGCWSALWCQ